MRHCSRLPRFRSAQKDAGPTATWLQRPRAPPLLHHDGGVKTMSSAVVGGSEGQAPVEVLAVVDQEQAPASTQHRIESQQLRRPAARSGRLGASVWERGGAAEGLVRYSAARSGLRNGSSRVSLNSFVSEQARKQSTPGSDSSALSTGEPSPSAAWRRMKRELGGEVRAGGKRRAKRRACP